jgi:hypothetical protein
MIDADSIDQDDLIRFTALVAALIATGLLWRSGLTGNWSPMVAEWLGFVGAMGIFLFPFAAYSMVDGWLARRRASAAVSWPRARGTIESSRVRLTSFKFALYVADVSYRYAVKGTDFTGDAIQATRVASFKSTARGNRRAISRRCRGRRALRSQQAPVVDARAWQWGSPRANDLGRRDVRGSAHSRRAGCVA